MFEHCSSHSFMSIVIIFDADFPQRAQWPNIFRPRSPTLIHWYSGETSSVRLCYPKLSQDKKAVSAHLKFPTVAIGRSKIHLAV